MKDIVVKDSYKLETSSMNYCYDAISRIRLITPIFGYIVVIIDKPFIPNFVEAFSSLGIFKTYQVLLYIFQQEILSDIMSLPKLAGLYYISLPISPRIIETLKYNSNLQSLYISTEMIGAFYTMELWAEVIVFFIY